MNRTPDEIPNRMWIDGIWCEASDGGRIEVEDPAREVTVTSVPRATAADVDRAVAGAERGFRAWRNTDAWSRSALLRRVAGLLRERHAGIAAVVTEEQGKPLAEARAEVGAAADQFDWFADEARRVYGRAIDGHSRSQRLFALREPVGPVAAFTPWNFPILLPARKIAPALAAGCSVVVKPAEEAPRAAFAIAKACEDAGLPPGVLNVLTGDPAETSRRLIASASIRKVSLTGSVPVGREILRLCAETLKPASLELGGHAPVLVFGDADVDRAAELAARGKFRNAGQVCVAASRLLVHESCIERFTHRFVEEVRALRLGDGRDPGTEIGPLASRRRLDAALSLVSDAVAKGARVECGGGRSPRFERGHFFEPTVLTGIRPGMRVLSEEPFSPIAPILPFRDLGEALSLANDTVFGLAGYVFTRDVRTAILASEGLEVGMVGVNQLVIATAELPFGGVKQSGFGRESASEGIDAYTITKAVSLLL
ncbi:succinate-semialdehyde dehydrogenase / glutarate-semialdehyde dehydrogenase [Myxococcaceae bacterium]|nr:succinate-semialdehyde dehydrogenase / glutarate-semialdehyde dehydrogenase [Myxococcaceae bacterium]